MFIIFVDYQRLTMVPTCSFMCFNDLLCSSSCCDDDRKLSMSDWAFVWTHVRCVTPLRLKLFTSIYYIYIYIYELLIVIADFTWLQQHADMNVCYLCTWCHGFYDIHGYTWIYMDIHVYMVPFSVQLLVNSALYVFCSKGARWRHFDPLRWHDQPWLCPRVTGG